MGDEVPNGGADDAPDPEAGEEPSARAEGDRADPSEGTDTDTEGSETDEAADGEDSEGLWADLPVPEDTSGTGGDPDSGDAADDDGSDDAAEELPDDDGSEEDADAGDTDAGDTDAGDTDDIPDDYDPMQPSVDLDYGAHQYPSPADDEGENGDAEDGSDTTDEGENGEGDHAAPDPEEVTEGWTDDEAVPAAEAGTASAKSDGGYADGTDAVDTYEPPDEDGEIFEGPPDDQEMPLADHIEEMVRRLGVVVVVMAVVSGIVFPFGERIINFLWYTVLVADPVPRPRVYHPLALILARLKVATLAGFIVALPVFVYESYQFMKPGLYPHERRYYLASVPTSLVLATVGVLFAYFLVLPALFTYFLYYSDEVTIIAFGLTETFDLMVLMLGGFAFIFQIPLFVMLAIMMGLTTRQWMADRRLYFWGAFLGLAFLFSPDPTGMAPIIVAATMVALFEGTLFLLKWTNRGRRRVPGG
jgi:sec-independent protein translocase protein TatC